MGKGVSRLRRTRAGGGLALRYHQPQPRLQAAPATQGWAACKEGPRTTCEKSSGLSRTGVDPDPELGLLLHTGG